MGVSSILVVEDDFIVAKVIEKSLLELGYRITGLVSSGEEAVAAVERERPALVLMDINLPGAMDGIDAADSIHTKWNVPVVFLTAFSDQKTFSRALETAPYGYILKPFQTNTLATTIEVALNKHRLEEEQAARHHWFEGALQSLSDGVITIDTTGVITLINPAAERMTGWAKGEAAGQRLNQVIRFSHPLTGKKGTISTDPVLKEGVVTTIPEGSLLIAKDGMTVPVDEAIASPIRDESGRITGAAVVLYHGDTKTLPAGASVPGEQRETPGQTLDRIVQQAVKVRKSPVTSVEWIDRGNTYVFTRRYDDAIRAYDRAISLHPESYQAWYGRGTALAKTGRIDEALAAYDRVLSIHPRNHQVLMAKGVLLRKAGREDEANRCFEMAHLYLP